MITLVRLRADHFKGLRDIDLTFPQQGSILIEGQNEAGKSTLFEAIYAALYGKALVGEDESRARLDDLITFDENGGWVELTFATTTAQLRVRRDFTRGKGQNASITVMHPDAADETRYGTTAVNERVLRELGNLDGDTLRNSCFVEQKELGRLESLSRGEREKAIERLLGLARLTTLAEHYRQEGKDAQKHLTRAEQLAEVAQAHAFAATMQQTIATTREAIDATRARSLLAALADLTAQTQAIATQRAQATAQLRETEERIDKAQQIAAWLQAQEGLARDIAQARSLRATIAMSASERQARLDAILTQDIPAAQQQSAMITQAQLALQARDVARQAWTDADLATRQSQAQQSAARDAQTALDDAQATLAAADTAVASTAAAAQTAAQELGDAEVRDALAGWLRVAATVANVSDFGTRERRLQEQYATAKGEADTANARARTMAIIMGCCLGLAGIGVALAIITHVYLLALTLIAAFAIIPALSANRAYQSATIIAQQAASAWREAQAQNEGARQAGADPALLAHQEALLNQLGVPADLSLDERKRRHAELAQRVTIAVPVARDTAQQARDIATAAHERADTARWQRDMLAAKVPPSMSEHEPDATTVTAQQAEEAWQTADATAQAALAAAGLSPDADTLVVVAEQAKITQRIAQFEQEATSAGEDLPTRQAELDAQLAAITTAWRALSDKAQAMRLVMPSPSPDATKPLEAGIDMQLSQLATTAQAKYRRLDPVGAQGQRDALNGQIVAQRLKGEQVTEEQAVQRAALVSLLAHHAITVAAQEPIDPIALARQWPLLAQPAATDTQEALNARISDAEQRRFAALERAQQLAAMLALTPETVAALDVASCTAAVSQLKQQLEVGRRAVEVINAARLHVVRQVLPTTERNMRVILPLLTAGRYHDVRLTAPEAPDGEMGEVDYRIRVWDTSARRYVGKAIFSGGARDQCSLALRLSFALATLPQELGIAPGFLFLDEPLSAFDGERAGALVHLLTQGHIARAFAQVLVISHQHAFSRADFRYHVRMERGRVIVSDLPTPHALPVLVQQTLS